MHDDVIASAGPDDQDGPIWQLAHASNDSVRACRRHSTSVVGECDRDREEAAGRVGATSRHGSRSVRFDDRADARSAVAPIDDRGVSVADVRVCERGGHGDWVAIFHFAAVRRAVTDRHNDRRDVGSAVVDNHDRRRVVRRTAVFIDDPSAHNMRAGSDQETARNRRRSTRSRTGVSTVAAVERAVVVEVIRITEPGGRIDARRIRLSREANAAV